MLELCEQGLQSVFKLLTCFFTWGKNLMAFFSENLRNKFRFQLLDGIFGKVYAGFLFSAVRNKVCVRVMLCVVHGSNPVQLRGRHTQRLGDFVRLNGEQLRPGILSVIPEAVCIFAP